MVRGKALLILFLLKTGGLGDWSQRGIFGQGLVKGRSQSEPRTSHTRECVRRDIGDTEIEADTELSETQSPRLIYDG